MKQDPRRSSFKLRLLSIIGILCLLMMAKADCLVFGANGEYVVVPGPKPGKRTPGFSFKSGLQLSVKTTWAGANGYRPVRLTFSSNKPLAAECQGTIQFYTHSWRRRREGATISVEKDFVLPLGSSSTSLTLFVPQLMGWDSYAWEVWIDGEKDNELSMRQFSSSSSGSGDKIAVLILTAENQNGTLLSQLPLEAGDSFDFVEQMFFGMPDTWLTFSGIDVVAMYLEDIALMEEYFPEKYEHLLRWVRLGGNLCVFQVGKVYSELDKIDELLSSKGGSGVTDSVISVSAWRELQESGVATSHENQLLALLSPRPSPRFSNSELPKLSIWNPLPTSRSKPWFLTRSFGIGTVSAFRNVNVNSWRSVDEELRKMLSAVGRSQLIDRFYYEERLGNDPKSGNRQFYDWHIPDVGTAPVLEFQFLISLFVICIGPLNYWILRRAKRLPLLIATVPLAALGTTLLLFTYGFLADGVGVRVRVRSFTYLDQNEEEVACWSRLSYYAGIGPSEGLHFPKDTAIYPVLAYRGRSSRVAVPEKEMEWDNEQLLTRGWLSSRTPTQYQTLTARNSTRNLEFELNGSEPTVRNQLGVDVLFLGVKDHEGNWFEVEDVGANEVKQLISSERQKVQGRLRLVALDNAPEFPLGFANARQAQRNDESESFFSGNLMETRMRALFSPVVDIWDKGSYVAITRSGVEVSLGLRDVTEAESYHVVQGTW